MAADVICLRNVQVTDPQGAFITWNDSNGSIERLMIQDSPAPVGGCLVDIRDNVYSTAAFPTLSHLRIGQLRLTGLTGMKEAGGFPLLPPHGGKRPGLCDGGGLRLYPRATGMRRFTRPSR